MMTYEKARVNSYVAELGCKPKDNQGKNVNVAKPKEAVAMGKALMTLRKALGLSQQTLGLHGARRRLARLDVLQFEKGNKTNSHDVRRGLIYALGLTDDELDDYLRGRITLQLILPKVKLSELPKPLEEEEESAVMPRADVADLRGGQHRKIQRGR